MTSSLPGRKMTVGHRVEVGAETLPYWNRMNWQHLPPHQRRLHDLLSTVLRLGYHQGAANYSSAPGGFLDAQHNPKFKLCPSSGWQT